MFTNAIFNKLQSALPNMSQTEQEALDAGTTWWDKELFSGHPDWSVIDYDPRIAGIGISEAAEDFLNGPVQELCEMLNDYEINKNHDLPKEVWDFLKENRFFGMVIPIDHGGLGFNAREHSEVVMKIATRSIAAAVTVMVPNSLGPGELLVHYGTEEQKSTYLNTLATGEDLPCFALTNPHAGSDASSIPDVGVVSRGMWGDVETLGMYLTFDKRYITLAPVATLMGLAIKVKDPDGLLPGVCQERLKVGSDITVVLMPTNTPGVEIGDRHDPLDIAFMNGPIRGNKVFVPLSYILGGPEMIGKGWSMLMECLSAGRAVSLPSLACAGGKVASIRTGAYSRIRKQFRLPVGKFEGVEEKLAMIAGYTYIMDASRKMTLDAVDMGEKPSVLSAICKYHLTEMNREVIDAAMDIQGGSGICLGPQNYIGKSYQSIPISITVEGANIMTRNLIIFGQGAIRNHPYAFDEMEALRNNHPATFNVILKKHIKHFISCSARALFHGLTGSWLSRVGIKTEKPKTVRQVNRFSAGFAFVTDVAMMLLGGSLKRKERVSARLGDILSYMYMLSAVHRSRAVADKDTFKYEPESLYEWSEAMLLYKIQEAFYGLFENFPVPGVGKLMRLVVFPYGRTFKKPSDKMDHAAAKVLMEPSCARANLGEGIFSSENPADQTWKLEDAFYGASQYDRIVRLAGRFAESTFEETMEDACFHWTINDTEKKLAIAHHKTVDEIVQVDSFKEL